MGKLPMKSFIAAALMLAALVITLPLTARADEAMPQSQHKKHKKIFKNPDFRVIGIGVVGQSLDKSTGSMSAAGGGLHLALFVNEEDSNFVSDATVDWSLNPLGISRSLDQPNNDGRRALGLVEAAHLGLAYRWSKKGCSAITGIQGRFRSSGDTRSDLDTNIGYFDANAGIFCVKNGRGFLLTPFIGAGSEFTTFAGTNPLKLAGGGRAKVVIDDRLYAMIELVSMGAKDYMPDGNGGAGSIEMGEGRATMLSTSADVKVSRNWYFAIRSDLTFMSLKGLSSGKKDDDYILSTFSSFVRKF